MSLTPSHVVENPQIPSIVAADFTPDQLIAGNQQLITDTITLLSGAGALTRGTILGKITAGAATAAAVGGNTGNGTMGAVTVSGVRATPGVYQLRIVTAAANAGQFQVISPDGDVVGIGNVAVAFVGGGLSFTLADGSADFIVGDGFNITVAAGSGKYIKSIATAVDGSQNPAGILVDTVDATSADKIAGIYLAGEFNENAIIYDASWTVATLKPLLRDLNINLKTAVLASDPS